MEICIFEDSVYEHLEPLIYARPVYDLVCGMNMLREKITRCYPGNRFSFHTRPYLEEYLKFRYPDIRVNEVTDDDCLFINGRMLAPDNLAELLPVSRTDDTAYYSGNTLAAIRLSGKRLDRVRQHLTDVIHPEIFSDLPEENLDIGFVTHTWDIIRNINSELLKDSSYFARQLSASGTEPILGTVHDGVHIIGREKVFIAEGAVVMPGVVLDASGGTIIIDKNAVVLPNAFIKGPVYIGQSSLIKAGTSVYEDVSIGKVCKVGGEIEHSIIHSYSNKQHSGFLGHAYLGSWVNIGADTNCSDLKNNYGNIKVYVHGQIVDTGTQFMGVVMGDHSKAGINTMFNTGTVVGFSCNIFGSGFPPKYLPSFSWGGSESVTTYDYKKSIETAKRVLQRRNRQMGIAEENLFHTIFEITQPERRKRGYPY